MKGWRSWAVLVVVVTLILTGFVFFHRPAHHYNAAKYGRAWNAEKNFALAHTKVGGCLRPEGEHAQLLGVGKLRAICTELGDARKDELVTFLTKIDQKETGLAYMVGFKAIPDTCNFHLGGPWWQLAPLTVSTMSCPRGFAFTGSG